MLYFLQWANMFEALAVVLEWISDSHLKHIDKSQVPDGVFSNEYTTDKCLKVNCIGIFHSFFYYVKICFYTLCFAKQYFL